MRLIFTCICCLFYPLFFAAQSDEGWTEGGYDNLVPNPGFEIFDGFPIGWYYKGSDFDAVMKYWTSPTTASPDAYGPRVRVPTSWAEKGFGKQTPHSGAKHGWHYGFWLLKWQATLPRICSNSTERTFGRRAILYFLRFGWRALKTV